VGRTLNFPGTHKILALPYPRSCCSGQDDDLWKKKVQDFIRDKKGDPKLFGYYFVTMGKRRFWFEKWKEMAACQRKVAGWVREIDANHVIMSASWLFGTRH